MLKVFSKLLPRSFTLQRTFHLCLFVLLCSFWRKLSKLGPDKRIYRFGKKRFRQSQQQLKFVLAHNQRTGMRPVQSTTQMKDFKDQVLLPQKSSTTGRDQGSQVTTPAKMIDINDIERKGKPLAKLEVHPGKNVPKVVQPFKIY